jgi:hypothetical protein
MSSNTLFFQPLHTSLRLCLDLRLAQFSPSTVFSLQRYNGVMRESAQSDEPTIMR